MANQERLQKLIANYGNYSRREAERLIEAKRVKLNGKIALLGTKASIEDQIMIDNQLIKFKTKHFYYLVNKPKGYICSKVDDKKRRVIDLVPNPTNRNLFTVGRLDVNTTGLIIVTTDGALAQLVNSPKYKVEKTYLVWLEKSIKKGDVLQLKTGIDIGEKVPTKPIKKVKIINNEPNKVLVKISLKEGKKNQIKRMFSALDNKVINLKRIQIANLVLDNKLASGDYRKYQKQEFYELLKID